MNTGDEKSGVSADRVSESQQRQLASGSQLAKKKTTRGSRGGGSRGGGGGKGGRSGGKRGGGGGGGGKGGSRKRKRDDDDDWKPNNLCFAWARKRVGGGGPGCDDRKCKFKHNFDQKGAKRWAEDKWG